MLHKIVPARIRYKAATGKPATNLYVGRAEWKMLAVEASEHWGCEIKAPMEGDERLEYCELRIFVVNAESHFAVGRDAEIFD